MHMSWPDQYCSRHRAPAAATGLAAGAVLPPAGASRAAAAPARGPVRATAGEYTNPVIWQGFADIDDHDDQRPTQAGAFRSSPKAPGATGLSEGLAGPGSRKGRPGAHGPP